MIDEWRAWICDLCGDSVVGIACLVGLSGQEKGPLVKVKDQSDWQGQLAEFAKDPAPEAAVLRDFVIKWTEAAEYRIVNNWQMVSGFEADKPQPSPIEGLRLTLRSVEHDQGRMPIGYLGMALLLIGEHWEPVTSIDDFFNSMTPIEQNLYADVASVKFLDLQRQAEELVDGND